jgi:uncharacterized protein (TIGR02145 family)
MMPKIFILLFLSVSLSLSAQTVQDFDGNDYRTINIGKQLWFVDNLKTSHFNDGTLIPLVNESSEWDSLKTGAYCWYNNEDSTHKDIYGALYNWYAVKTEKLCPLGWHVPSNSEWDTLIAFLDGNYIAGGLMKEVGTTHWKEPNTGATNESGFSAIPGGFRIKGNGFNNKGNSGYWWTSTEFKDEKACSRILLYYSNIIYKDHNLMVNGYSVRCVKDD